MNTSDELLPYPAEDAAASISQFAYTNPQSIIWIASYPKSGNTWVRVFVHNLLRELSASGAPAQNINNLHERTGWQFDARSFEAIIGKEFSTASHRELAEARPKAQAWLARSRPGPFLAKTHLCVGREFEVPTINLDATLAAIYIVRNPLDVAAFAKNAESTTFAGIICISNRSYRWCDRALDRKHRFCIRRHHLPRSHRDMGRR